MQHIAGGGTNAAQKRLCSSCSTECPFSVSWLRGWCSCPGWWQRLARARGATTASVAISTSTTYSWYGGYATNTSTAWIGIR